MYEEHITEYFVSPRSLRRQASEKSAPKLGRTIGSVSKASKRVVPFDPNAINADGDLTVQDGTIWERPAKPGLLSGLSGSVPSPTPRLMDEIIENDLAGKSAKQGQQDEAELIDAAILEQIQLAVGEISPKQAEATRQLVDRFETKPGKKKPSPIFIIKNSLEKYNIDFETDHNLESLITGLIDENPNYEEFDLNIKNHFFATQKTRDKVSLKQHQSRDYKYGDKSALGGEIRATRSDWLDGLTPKQIAKIIIPSNQDEAFEIHLDVIYGDDADLIRADDVSLALARASFNSNVYEVNINGVVDKDGKQVSIKLTNTPDSEIQILRSNLEQMLSERPEFLEAVRKLGMPPIIPLDIEPNADPEISKEFRKLGAWYQGSTSYIGFPTENMFRLQAHSIEESMLYEKISNGESLSVARELSLVLKTTMEKAIAHEWGHYIQHMARKNFRRKNNVVNVSYTGERRGYKKFNDIFRKLSDISLALTPPSKINAPVSGSLVISDTDLLDLLNKQRESIMSNARTFSDAISQISYELAQKLKGGGSTVDAMKEARVKLNEIMRVAASGGVISAPTTYGASSPQEQFAELVSFFFSGPLSRRVLSPDALKFFTDTFSGILPDGFDQIDKEIKSAEDLIQ